MKKIVVVLLFLTLIVFAPIIKGDEIDDIKHQLENLSRDLTTSLNATKPLESELTKLQKRLEEIKARVTYLESEIQRKELEVKKGEEALTYQKTILDQRIFAYYKNAKKAEISFITLVAADNLSTSLQNFFYQKTLADQDKQTILKVIIYIKNLEEKKKSLESENLRLASIKTEVDKNYNSLNGEVSKAKKYQSELSSKIAQLSARQQSLLAQKLAGLNIPRSAGTSQGGCVDDRDKDPGFGNRFAFFTFGVPNRVGMNQYGAKGRADAGQSYDEILHAYFNFDSYQDYDNIKIKVNDGNGINQGSVFWEESLEEYLKRIYEIPGDWNVNALKAQAIAARSYVLAATDNGKNSICANQYCQVFKKDPKGGQWESAVNDTAKKVMVQGGNPIKAWFSSTHGGIILKSSELPGWSDTSWTKHGNDTREGASSIEDLRDSNKAYDKSSPWFYCDWGSRAQYNGTAWLKSEELADIVNSLILAKRDSSNISHLYQPDKSNSEGVDTWDKEKVKNELKSQGENPFNSVSRVSISADVNAGRTNTVTIEGDAGIKSFSGSEFKDIFNWRAPANIQIVGPLFNVEHK